jgi:hypothetical protein
MFRFLTLLCGLAVGAYSLPAAFLNGLAMAPGTSGYIIGSAMVGMLGWSWLGGSQAAQVLASGARVRGTIILATSVTSVVTVLVLSAGFVATHRGETVGERQMQIERYERAKVSWQRSNAEIQAADAAGKKVPSARRQELHEAEGKLEAGRPAASDAQAETLSSVFSLVGYRIDAAKIEQAFPIWLSVSMELASYGAFMAWSFTPAQASAPVKKIKRKAKRAPRRSKPPAKAVVRGRDHMSDEDVIDFREQREKRALRMIAGLS